MNTLTDRQQHMLARGLAAFETASAKRRARRRIMRGASAAAIALAAGAVMFLTTRAGPSGLPPYVEIISGDVQLTAELELANACERINRAEGRLVVVECTVHPAAD